MSWKGSNSSWLIDNLNNFTPVQGDDLWCWDPGADYTFMVKEARQMIDTYTRLDGHIQPHEVYQNAKVFEDQGWKSRLLSEIVVSIPEMEE
ncbi:hypothetical protein L2E82_49633 [Cichorium intybus]|uniref:Uncharacterized protein n=1 Tax=Cichorium intybus TaxID=13427 RepID=A0ACB8Z160_CICIN|nr:hypothetical protein L2E82_49633 [Cichorium intybus]